MIWDRQAIHVEIHRYNHRTGGIRYTGILLQLSSTSSLKSPNPKLCCIQSMAPSIRLLTSPCPCCLRPPGCCRLSFARSGYLSCSSVHCPSSLDSRIKRCSNFASVGNISQKRKSIQGSLAGLLDEHVRE